MLPSICSLGNVFSPCPPFYKWLCVTLNYLIHRLEFDMEGRIAKSTAFLKELHKYSHQSRKRQLRAASRKQINSLCECVYNLTLGNVPVSAQQLHKLKPYKKTLQQISFGKGNLESRRRLLIQRGGFLPALAAALLPLVGGLVERLIRWLADLNLWLTRNTKCVMRENCVKTQCPKYGIQTYQKK